MISGNILSSLINNNIIINVTMSKGPFFVALFIFTVIAFLLLLLIRFAYRRLKRTKNAV